MKDPPLFILTTVSLLSYGDNTCIPTVDQETLWHETLADDPAVEADCRQGEQNPININQRLLHDIQVLVSRLVAKASQLLGNFTTNMAESWMHVRSKYDGGKVINHSQSGSWGY